MAFAAWLLAILALRLREVIIIDKFFRQ